MGLYGKPFDKVPGVTGRIIAGKLVECVNEKVQKACDLVRQAQPNKSTDRIVDELLSINDLKDCAGGGAGGCLLFGATIFPWTKVAKLFKGLKFLKASWAAKALVNEEPAYTGGKTAGTLVRPSGAEEALISGWHPPAVDMPKGTPGMNIVTKSHVEAHAAAIMRKEGLTEATVWINRAPCEGAQGCGAMLMRMVPRGSTLTIYVVPHGSAGSIAEKLMIPGVG